MVKQMPDVCGSPPAKVKMDGYKPSLYRQRKTVVCCFPFCLLASWLVAILFAGLFAWQLRSDPARHLEECKGRLQNDTSAMSARIAVLGQRVETQEGEREKARAEGDKLRVQLAIANQTVQTTSENWETCKEQLESLEGNVTLLVSEAVQPEMEKYKRAEEKIKRLEQQLSDKLQELKDIQLKTQQQQETCQAIIQHLQEHSMDRSRGDILHGTSVVLLPLILAMLLL